MRDKMYMDLGQIMDEIFGAAEKFGDMFGKGFKFHHEDKGHPHGWNENVDYYPHHSYPPANVYMTADRTLVFEFALAGFDESSIDLQFQGDYMVLSAKVPEDSDRPDDIRYFKRRLKLKSFSDQRYYVPADKFDREAVTALYRNGVLKVTIPPKAEVPKEDGVKINIVNEDEETADSETKNKEKK